MTKPSSFFKRAEMAYGGELLKKRRAREQGRPLSTSHSMHLVLRSTKAVGEWSFKKSRNRSRVEGILGKFAKKYGIRILSLANVGNHIHLHMQLTSRHTYKPFIRAVTAAIAMAVTGVSRWNKEVYTDDKRRDIRSDDDCNNANGKGVIARFWDRRPFTRIVIGRRGYINVSDYVTINQFEGLGRSREQARFYVAWRKTEKDLWRYDGMDTG